MSNKWMKNALGFLDAFIQNNPKEDIDKLKAKVDNLSIEGPSLEEYLCQLENELVNSDVYRVVSPYETMCYLEMNTEFNVIGYGASPPINTTKDIISEEGLTDTVGSFLFKEGDINYFKNLQPYV